MQTSELGSVLVKNSGPAYLSFGFSLIATVVVVLVIGPRMQCSLVWAPFSFRTSLSKSNFLGPSNPLYESYFIHQQTHSPELQSHLLATSSRCVPATISCLPSCPPSFLPSFLPWPCFLPFFARTQKSTLHSSTTTSCAAAAPFTHKHHHHHHHHPVQVAGLFNSYTNRG